MAGDVNDPYRNFEVVVGRITHLRDVIEEAEPEIKRRVKDALKHYTIGELGGAKETPLADQLHELEIKVSVLERELHTERARVKKAEKQFDELAVIHNRVQQERNDALADLAEAREVLWALRPVLRGCAKVPTIINQITLGRWSELNERLPWLEKWLHD